MKSTPGKPIKQPFNAMFTQPDISPSPDEDLSPEQPAAQLDKILAAKASVIIPGIARPGPLTAEEILASKYWFEHERLS